MRLNRLIEMSRKYGADADYVLAGGGNTSYKQDGIMAVKASGSALGSIDETGFVFMDVQKLREMPDGDYPAEDTAREAKAMQDMMAARLAEQADKRPSVECILHALFEEAYVLHLHPALVNGMTCGANGAQACAEIFGGAACWVPLTKPGLVLSRTCKQLFGAHKAKYGKAPGIVFLQNHGVFVAADTTEEIDQKMRAIMNTLMVCIKREPDMTMLETTDIPDVFIPGSVVSCACTREILSFAQSVEMMRPLLRPFTPDHIVYCKAAPLYVENVSQFPQAYRDLVEIRGFEPLVAVVKDVGAFGMGETQKTADTALQVFLDGVRIAVYSESFGGPLGLDDAFTDFIANWEIESYRAKKSLSEEAI